MAQPESMMNQSVPPLGTFSRFMQETELQRLLTDEKLRSEQHKLNFQALKTEFTRFQEEYKKLQNQLKQITDEHNMGKESYETMIQQYKTELIQKQSKIEELRKDVMTPQQVHLLRMSLIEEIEKPYRDRFAAAEEETEQYRETCNKLRYSYSFLKAEFEHAQQEFDRLQEETKLKYEAELARIMQERNNLQSALAALKKTHDSSSIKEIQSENIELKHRLKLLQSEIEELRAQKDHSSSQTDSLQRLQTKQFAEHTATLRAMELEKSSLQMQVDRLQRELKEGLKIQNDLNTELKESQQKVKEMHTKLQDAEYKCRIDSANLRMELMKEKGEVERERDHFLGEVESIKTELEAAQQTFQQQLKVTEELERESRRQLQTVQEEEWKKIRELETEKMELETKVEELEHLHMDSETRLKTLLAKQQTDQLFHLKEKDALQSEVEILKSKIKRDSLPYEEQLQKKETRSRLEEENEKLYEAKVELEAIVKEIKRQHEQCQKLLDETRSNLAKSQNDTEKEKILRDTVLIQHQLDWEEMKIQFQKRIALLEHQLTETRSKCSGESQLMKMKMKKYRQILVKLRNQSRLSKARIEELEAERELLKKNVSHEEHRLVQKQLRELQRRLREYDQTVLVGEASAISLGTESSNPVNYRGTSLTTMTDREIAAVKDRIQILSKKQRRQLIQLNRDADGNAADKETSESSD